MPTNTVKTLNRFIIRIPFITAPHLPTPQQWVMSINDSESQQFCYFLNIKQNGITEHSSFWDLVFSLGTLPLHSGHIVYLSGLFLFITECCYTVWVFYSLFKQSSLLGHFVCFWCLAIKLKSPWTFVYRILWGHEFSFLWNKCPRVYVLDDMLSECLIFQDTGCSFLSRMHVLFYVPPSLIFWRLSLLFKKFTTGLLPLWLICLLFLYFNFFFSLSLWQVTCHYDPQVGLYLFIGLKIYCDFCIWKLM